MSRFEIRHNRRFIAGFTLGEPYRDGQPLTYDLMQREFRDCMWLHAERKFGRRMSCIPPHEVVNYLGEWMLIEVMRDKKQIAELEGKCLAKDERINNMKDMRLTIFELEEERDELKAELAECRERMMKAEAACKEASDYLETNALTNIAHGSILHRMFQDIRATTKAEGE